MSGNADIAEPEILNSGVESKPPGGEADIKPENEAQSAFTAADDKSVSEAQPDALGRKPTEEPVDVPRGKFGTFISAFRPQASKDGSSKLAKSEAEQFYGHLRDQKKLDLGWIGFVIGHGVEKLGNIAFISILICFAIVIGLLWAPVNGDAEFREKTAATLFGVINLALGYLFGKTTVAADAPKDKEK
ncbi:hypothetical protein HHL28_01495 [Aerophototrophica crusticola]|uniref:Uncharacterized protein n=1 Tax=Aerophototrophica crusticola TaxID=1709002 RepID=A0A858R3K7_9PROT|nr:hypothetical protein HHL28_01495 [Rhodospirillaceae bacterium B3]